MAQRKRGERVLGPYPIGKQWRIVVVGSGGERDSRFYPTEEQAREVMRAIRREFAKTTDKTLNEALDAYEQYLREEKENKLRSVQGTIYRVRLFFPDGEVALGDLTKQRCAGYYAALRKRGGRRGRKLSVDSHRNTLAEAKTFLRWCAKQGWISRNPLEGVDGVGKRKHGKEQLRIDEARKWAARAFELAEAGEEGAVAALMALVMGMRATEVVSRVVRDLDDGGKLLWIPDSKTPAGRRTLEVPQALQPHLRRLAAARGGPAARFFKHWRDWVRDWVQRICKEARVPVVTAHGMRGLHSTLAIDHGVTPHVVAAALGHESSTTTLESYAKPEAVAAAQQRRVLRVLEGAKLAS